MNYLSRDLPCSKHIWADVITWLSRAPLCPASHRKAPVCVLSKPRSHPRDLWPPSYTAISILKNKEFAHGSSNCPLFLIQLVEFCSFVFSFYTKSQKGRILAWVTNQSKITKDWRPQNKVTGRGSLPKSEGTNMCPWLWGAEKLPVDLGFCAIFHSVLQPMDGWIDRLPVCPPVCVGAHSDTATLDPYQNAD